jgi:hypothetical protein
MDTAYCVRCDSFISDSSDAAYCSQTCYDLDHPEPVAFQPEPTIAPIAARTSPAATPIASHYESRSVSPCALSVRDWVQQNVYDQVPPQQSLPARVVPSKWTGKTHEGILNWVQNVHGGSEGGSSDDDDEEEEYTYSEADLALDAHFCTRPALPLTAHILAPAVPSLLTDDTHSYVTPCTDESIVTPPSALEPSLDIAQPQATVKLSPVRSNGLRWFTATTKAAPALPVLEKGASSSDDLTAADIDALMPVGVDASVFANAKEKLCKAKPQQQPTTAVCGPGKCGSRASPPTATYATTTTNKNLWIFPDVNPPAFRARDRGARWDDELLLQGLDLSNLDDDATPEDEDDEEDRKYAGRRAVPTSQSSRAYSPAIERGRTLSRHSRDRGHERMMVAVA